MKFLFASISILFSCSTHAQESQRPGTLVSELTEYKTFHKGSMVPVSESDSSEIRKIQRYKIEKANGVFALTQSGYYVPLDDAAVAMQHPKPLASFEFRIVDSTSADKSTLYTRARSWVASNFKSAKDVIQMDDKESGKIICKGTIAVNGAKNGFGMDMGDDYVWFTATIDVKDRKFRIVLNDFRHEGGNYGTHGYAIPSGGSLDLERPACGTFSITMNRWRRTKEYAAARSRVMLLDFSTAMKSDKQSNDGF